MIDDNKKELIPGLVSVIIPVFNSAKYLPNTLESVLIQSYNQIEIVIVDDCSTDNTKVIIEQYQKNRENIIYYFQNPNQGAAVARNVALKMASGQYVAFIDSDDLWEKEKITKQVELLRKTECAFCFSAYDIVNEIGQKIKDKIKIKKEISYNDLLTTTMISTPTVMIDREKTGEVFMPLRRTGQDYGFWLFLLRQWKATGIDEPLVHVRKRPNSLSKNKFQNILDVFEVQTRLEGIPIFVALRNVLKYCLYALSK